MRNRGFSLIELAVTLAIVGLVVAGITAGTHLIKTAEIQKVISEFSGYVTAVDNFKNKYNALPGDMPNATSFWGTYNAVTNVEGTVNGSGNERLDDPVLTGEELRAWQQLALSSMIVGHYSGVDAGTPDFQADVNVPPSVIKGRYYYLNSTTPIVTTIYKASGTFLQLGSSDTDTSPWGSAMTPADAFVIDTKIDDAEPDAGEVYFFRGWEYSADATKCVDQDFDSNSGNPILTDPTESCRVIIWISKD